MEAADGLVWFADLRGSKEQDEGISSQQPLSQRRRGVLQSGQEHIWDRWTRHEKRRGD